VTWRGFDAAQRAWDNATPPDDECCDPADGCLECPVCHGAGSLDGDIACAACDGDGRVVCCGYNDDYDCDGPDDYDGPCEMECDYGDTKY
jgi:RecJ-like exonuclease